MSSPMSGNLRRGNDVPGCNNHNESGRRRRSNNNDDEDFSKPSPTERTSVTPRATTTTTTGPGGGVGGCSHHYSSTRIAANGGGSTFSEKVVVAIDSNKKITKNALEWALTNVLVHPGETIILLVLLPTEKPVHRKWGLSIPFQILGKRWGSAAGLPAAAASPSSKGPTKNEVEKNLHHSCMLMVEELHAICTSKKINIEVKMVEPKGPDTVANEVKNLGATWIVLDRHLKKEGKCCVELLQCNIVVVTVSEPKILQLILKRTESSPRVRQQPPNMQSTLEAQSLQVSSRKSENTRNPSKEFVQYHYCEEPNIVTRNGVKSNYSSSNQTTPSSSPEEQVTTPFTASNAGGGSSELGISTSENTSAEIDTARQNRTFHSKRMAANSVNVSPVLGSSPPELGLSPPELAFRGGSNHKLKPSNKILSEAKNPSLKPPSGNRAVVHSRDLTVPSRPSSRSASRSASRASSRRDSPVKALQRESPAKLLRSSSSSSSRQDQSPTREMTRTGYRQEQELGQSLRVILQVNMEMDQSPFNGGSPSGYQGDYEPANDSPLPRQKQGKTDVGISSGRNRMATMLSKYNLPGPPPLCSICQHKSPVFGKPPLRYTYAELERATGGFSQANFLAEGGYGSVHRGILSDGQAVAVKQYKLASMQGDREFCSEVEILSCAQHRNVVMLIGFCIEGKRRLLVYEFICNGSLDLHLYDQERTPLEWASRQKIALGTARGLRYLHQECRVGCIVHRDLRPNNIVVTHDFEPMVGDFGLARWQPDGQGSVETRVVGTFGYLAPEYTQHGQVTHKSDVYSFGVVLLELVTGRRAIDITRPKGEQCLTEWARPLLEEMGTIPLDPSLDNQYSDMEVHCMLHAAACCIRRDPQQRPNMSQVIRMLEGEMIVEVCSAASPVAAYFAERLPHEYNIGRSTAQPILIKKATTTTPTTTGEEIENVNNLDTHQSDQESLYSSPNGEFFSNYMEYTPPFEPTRSPTTTKDFNSRLNMTTTPSPIPPPSLPLTPSVSNLSFEALKSAYADKGYYAPVSAAAYESYSLGKDF